VRDSSEALFRWGPWIDRRMLKTRFNRLFDLADNKLATVADMFSLGWGEG